LQAKAFTMLHTYEATLETNGQVWFTDSAKPLVKQRQKVLVTIVSPLAEAVFGASPATVDKPSHNAKKPDWQAFAGLLKDTAAFAGDPLAVQQQLRSEWR
jgi:hypothetical protein